MNAQDKEQITNMVKSNFIQRSLNREQRRHMGMKASPTDSLRLTATENAVFVGILERGYVSLNVEQAETLVGDIESLIASVKGNVPTTQP